MGITSIKYIIYENIPPFFYEDQKEETEDPRRYHRMHHQSEVRMEHTGQLSHST